MWRPPGTSTTPRCGEEAHQEYGKAWEEGEEGEWAAQGVVTREAGTGGPQGQ